MFNSKQMLLIMYIFVAILMFAVVSGKVPHKYDTVLYFLIFLFFAYHVYKLADTTESFKVTSYNTHNIFMLDSYPGYSNRALTIKIGDTVQWKNKGSHNHTATSDCGAFNSGTLKTNQKYSIQFTKPGMYRYHCMNNAGWMIGTIRVQ